MNETVLTYHFFHHFFSASFSSIPFMCKLPSLSLPLFPLITSHSCPTFPFFFHTYRPMLLLPLSPHPPIHSCTPAYSPSFSPSARIPSADFFLALTIPNFSFSYISSYLPFFFHSSLLSHNNSPTTYIFSASHISRLPLFLLFLFTSIPISPLLKTLTPFNLFLHITYNSSSSTSFFLSVSFLPLATFSAPPSPSSFILHSLLCHSSQCGFPRCRTCKSRTPSG